MVPRMSSAVTYSRSQGPYGGLGASRAVRHTISSPSCSWDVAHRRPLTKKKPPYHSSGGSPRLKTSALAGYLSDVSHSKEGRTMRNIILLVCFALGVVACEGPEGPAGPIGPQGPQGETGPRGATGPPRDGVLIEITLSTSAYDLNGNISIADPRITPESFLGLYIKVELTSGQAAYVPVGYLLLADVAFSEEADEWLTPIIAVSDGVIVISDPNLYLLDLAFLLGYSEETENVEIAILVSG